MDFFLVFTFSRCYFVKVSFFDVFCCFRDFLLTFSHSSFRCCCSICFEFCCSWCDQNCTIFPSFVCSFLLVNFWYVEHLRKQSPKCLNLSCMHNQDMNFFIFMKQTEKNVEQKNRGKKLCVSKIHWNEDEKKRIKLICC